ncbi:MULTISPECIES: hypothetical protein [Methanobrevibacter]|nr:MULTISPECIES: hypothetical protein [Methanobrevibacter]MDY3096532.1 hypothetical protein [Methanobrevibacter sp.]
MSKKLFAILGILLVLVVSVGVISAEENANDDTQVENSKVKVSVSWNDDGNTDNRPSSISVTIKSGGNVIGTLTLSQANGWQDSLSATGGDYSISIDDVASYSKEISQNGDSFNVVYSNDGQDVDDTPENDTDDDSDIVDDDNSTDDDDSDIVDDDNSTDDDDGDSDLNGTNGNDDSLNVDKNAPLKNKIVKQNKVLKQNNNVTKKQLRQTGLPIAVLVLVLIVVALVPISRRKK